MIDLLTKILQAFNASKEYIEKILQELELLGITELYNEGPIQLHTNVYVVGKGQNSVVVKAKLLSYYDCVCKILRPDASRKDLLHEAKVLIKANTVNVGPRLFTFTRHVLVLEYIKGEPLDRWIAKRPPRDVVRRFVTDVLEQCYRLDVCGIVHDELSRPREHILVDENGKAHIIDFETSSLEPQGKRKNLTQVLNALVLGPGDVAKYVRETLDLDEEKVKKLRELLSEYKRNTAYEIFNKIQSLLMGN